MSNEYIFFISTAFIYLVIFKTIKMVRKNYIKDENDEQRSGTDRRKNIMYRIPERRNNTDTEHNQERRGQIVRTTSGLNQRRSGNDRRKGGSRRQWQIFKIPENRKLSNRRDGLDRRKSQTSPDPVVA